jgi:hypothetical protein
MRNRGHRAGWALATSAITWAVPAQAGETVTYSYDSLGRLVRVERSGTVNNGVNSAYCYDPADNRTLVTAHQAAAPQCPVSPPPPPPPSDDPPPPTAGDPPSPPPPPADDPPPSPPADPPPGPPPVEEPLRQKKPDPATSDGDSPTPAEPSDDPESSPPPGTRIAFEPQSRGRGDSSVFGVRLADRAAARGPGPSGSRVRAA